MTVMYKIAVIGRKDTILGFKALGLDTFPVNASKDAGQAFRGLTSREEPYAVIYLEEQFAEALAPDIEGLNGKAFPAVVLIPGQYGSGDADSNILQKRWSEHER